MHLGASAVEVTDLRTLDALRQGLMAATRETVGKQVRFKAGVMAVVLGGGEVRPGDAIRIERPPGPHEPLKPL